MPQVGRKSALFMSQHLAHTHTHTYRNWEPNQTLINMQLRLNKFNLQLPALATLPHVLTFLQTLPVFSQLSLCVPTLWLWLCLWLLVTLWLVDRAFLGTKGHALGLAQATWSTVCVALPRRKSQTNLLRGMWRASQLQLHLLF